MIEILKMKLKAKNIKRFFFFLELALICLYKQLLDYKSSNCFTYLIGVR